MQVTSENKDRLVITNNSTGWSRLFAVVGLFCLLAGVWQFYQRGASSEQFGGAMAGLATCVLGALALYERSHFVVDAKSRLIEWRRRRAFRERRGCLRFDQVRQVIAQSPLGDEGTPSRRVVFQIEGGELPVTIAFLPDPNDVIIGLALKVRSMIGARDDEPISGNVTALAAAGRDLEAIKALRAERGLSLTDAHAAVKAMRAARR
jgi:hypothetical protein